MKNIFTFFLSIFCRRNHILKAATFFLFLIISILLFQGQHNWMVFDDDNPFIEQPTLEAYLTFKDHIPLAPSIVTVNDFDNFDIGIDFWEQNATSNPSNPLSIFFGVNATSSGQNARGSTNGGLNWYLNNPAYHPSICCDPWSTYTGNGVLIYASGVTGQYIYRSTNNGLNWSVPILSVSGNDRNHVSAEYTGNGPYANYVYAAMTPGNFARSTNAGLNWTTTFNPSNSLPGCYIAVGPNGAVDGGCVIYVTNTGSDFGNRVYNFYRSTNGGANFTLMSSQSGWAGFVGFHTGSRHTINNVRTAPHPKIAMDNSNGPYRGRLYLVHASNDPPGNGNKPDIWLRYSTNQGANWSAATRVNDNSNPTLSDQWFPEISCEATTGRLYIHWYDDRSNPATFQTAIYATYTTDGGQTFAPSQRVTNTTFTFPNPPCSPNCYRGDYTGITGNPNAAFSVWGDHRNATAQNMGAFFPDFAMRVIPTSNTVNNLSDSSLHYVSIPAVKLWDKTAKFTATINPIPSSGLMSVAFLNRADDSLLDSLVTFPDSLKVWIKTSGGVTPGNYVVTIRGNGTNGTPVHVRDINITVIAAPVIKVNLKVLVEGLYFPLPDQLNRKDTVSLYLRDAVSPYTMRDSGRASIDTISFSGLYTYLNRPTGQYYLVAKHFISIETWSKSSGEPLVGDGSIYNYDFTSAVTQAFGNNLKLKGTRYCIYSGDVNQDGVVDGTDAALIDNDAFNFETGYLLTDLNGDYVVDGSDYLIADNNSAAFIEVISP